MYIPKHFTPKECFPPEIAPRDSNKFDTRNWRRFRPEVLVSSDMLRDNYGPMTGNEGKLKGCGFRLPLMKGSKILYNINALSDHCFGGAMDLHPKEETVEKIRMDIVRYPGLYPFITFLEIDITWLHIAYRNNVIIKNDLHRYNSSLDGRIELWSPVRGFVPLHEYLETGELKNG